MIELSPETLQVKRHMSSLSTWLQKDCIISHALCLYIYMAICELKKTA